jgi:hypothetical protein
MLERSSAAVLVITTRRPGSSSVSTSANAFDLEQIGLEALIRHLMSEFGYALQDAQDLAEEMIAFTDDVPSRLHVGLSLRRLRNLNEVA